MDPWNDELTMLKAKPVSIVAEREKMPFAWNDELTMLKAKPVSIVAEREKMPFEITPFVIYLNREQPRAGQKQPAVAAESNADPGAVPGDAGAPGSDPK